MQKSAGQLKLFLLQKSDFIIGSNMDSIFLVSIEYTIYNCNIDYTGLCLFTYEFHLPTLQNRTGSHSIATELANMHIPHIHSHISQLRSYDYNIINWNLCQHATHNNSACIDNIKVYLGGIMHYIFLWPIET